MSDVPRQTLRNLIAKYGRDLCSDAGRCEGLLRDLCGAYRREINILISALEERVPLDLLAAHTSMPRELLLTRLTRRLEDQLALTEEAARWAVDSWALALGVITDREIEERRRKHAETVPPPATTTAHTPDSEGVKGTKPPVAPPPAQPPSTTPSWQRTQQQPHNQPPTLPRPVKPPPAATRQPPHASTPGGSTIARRRTPAATTLPVPPSPAPKMTRPQTSSSDPAPGKRRGTWRGCLIGCFLLVVLSLLLFLVAPFVVTVLREEQMQRSNDPSRTLPQ
ncbi:MAG: hypothetical protein M3430_16250 [Acidobacteriota bacterium]|nr:hypothetical protein [Acidobacteriota bacterium]